MSSFVAGPGAVACRGERASFAGRARSVHFGARHLGAWHRISLRGQAFAHARGHGRELELRARDVLQQRVGGRLLAERPQLAQEVTRGTAREPVAAELVAEEVAQLRLERPRAQVARDIEAAVDVVEVAL